MPGPLHGITVLDLSSTFLGPYGTLQLVDLGADVVLIEPPAGEITRSLGTVAREGLSSVFVAANRGKSSVVLDLKGAAGQQALKALVEQADVLVHNMRPSAAERLGIDATALLTLNPRLVHCTANGFGTQGPYAGRPAYDDIIQAMSGLAALQGQHTGEPTYVASTVVDKTIGLMVANAVLAALLHRERTGVGQAVEVPMFEGMVAFLLVEQLGGASFIPHKGPVGYSRTATRHRRPYPTLDGHLGVVVYTPRQWERFLTHVGRVQLLKDPRYATAAARSANIDDLYAIIAEELASRTTAEWLRVLVDLEIPAVRVNSLDDLLSDPHLSAVGMFAELAYPGGLTVRATRSPLEFSASPAEAPRPAAEMGRDTERVLAAAGLSPTVIAAAMDEAARHPSAPGGAKEGAR